MENLLLYEFIVPVDLLSGLWYSDPSIFNVIFCVKLLWIQIEPFLKQVIPSRLDLLLQLASPMFLAHLNQYFTL
jgi:hypothetical protein